MSLKEHEFWNTGMHPVTGWFTGKARYPKERYPIQKQPKKLIK
tara:strand:+ start:213 stop:341 length:129 start_codon:yes stop_codon:yes gene_type:complete